jgi:hypothetical protein
MVLAAYPTASAQSKTKIGFWAWELEESPKVFRNAAGLLDEVWTISSYVKTSLDQVARKPVKVVGLPVPFPMRKTVLRREDLGIPHNRFLVTTSFDYMSDFRRKNPLASIKAYKEAFRSTSEAVLVVKSINSRLYPDLANAVEEHAEGRPDIILMSQYLTPYETGALLELSDVFISLHRAEGYGLNIVDAIARQTAVVATGYSGNLEFMDSDSSVLVPYDLVNVNRYAGHGVRTHWAEPDTSFAAANLRELFRNPELLRKNQVNAQEWLRTRFALRPAVSRFLEEFTDARL